MHDQLKNLHKLTSEGTPSGRLGKGDVARLGLPTIATAFATVLHFWTGGPSYLIPQYTILTLALIYFISDTRS
jgi:hypothetical protein